MGTVKSVLADDVQQVTGSALQGALVDLIDLSLTGKQAHWNVTGRTFKQVHEHLDELIAETRESSDSVAERAVMIGLNPDGRVETVARSTSLPALEPGYLPEDKVIAAITQQLAAVIGRMRVRIAETEPDPVTQDLLIGITAGLEKQHWMFSVQQ
ncbi:DNA starvation/stationary phase protection protein [Actinocorallia longicatena]|uniref:DNA starvation/stationary phase protection protein n=1 Tax=Actinocorallia longicatena TaxID=111803 RepID=A0ABP6QPA6_9ACTN